MNVFDAYQRKFMAFPAMALVPVNNTTKKIQNYQFKLNEILGRGNFSTVYRGLNELTNQPVAIKVVQLNSIRTPALVELLYSQIQILKTLNHPNIMRCYEVFTSANNCYIITELCSDGDLQTRIRNRGPIPEREAYKTIYQIYQGLKYLADQGIVHRDFKVANILFNRGVAKIADFGFAKKTRDRFKDISVGSPIYMSPEGLIDNVYGPKTDVWAYGVFIFEILHGDTPLAFCKSEADLKVHIMTPLRMQSFHPSISMDLRQLVLRCIDANENRRISIYEIQQTTVMRRISCELGVIQNMDRNAHSNSRGKQLFDRPGSHQGGNYTPKALLPPRAQLANILAQNQRTNSPRAALLQGKQSISFQNPSNNNINIPKRGVSVERTNYFNAQQPLTHAASLSQDRNKPSSQNQINPAERNYKVVGRMCVLDFYEFVGLLHYCRLVYKVTSQLVKLEPYIGSQLKEYFINWLFQIFKEVQSMVPSNVKYEGKKAAIREKKLQDVIKEYHQKYFKDLQITIPLDANLKGIQQSIPSILKVLDVKMNEPYIDKRELIVTAHYLMFLYEVNLVLQKTLQTNNYSILVKNCDIESFLSVKKESYDENSYKLLRMKIAQIVPS